MNCENGCVNEHRLNTIEHELDELRRKSSNDNKEFYNRIEFLEKENALLKRDIEHIKETMDEMNENIKTLMQRPQKRYDAIIASAITAVIGGIIGFIMSGILPM